MNMLNFQSDWLSFMFCKVCMHLLSSNCLSQFLCEGDCACICVYVCVYMHRSLAQDFACTLACWLISGCNLQAHSGILAPRAPRVPEHWCPPARPSASLLTHRWFGAERALGILLQIELKHLSIENIKTLETHDISLNVTSAISHMTEVMSSIISLNCKVLPHVLTL